MGARSLSSGRARALCSGSDRHQERGITPTEPAACPLCGADDGAALLTSAAQLHPEREPFTFRRCRRCALVYLSPRVAPSALDRYYGPTYLPHRGEAAWGRFAPAAAAGQRRTDAARVRLARRVAALGPGSQVLDVGCGRPTFLEALCAAIGARGAGLDPSDAGWAEDPGRWRAAGLTLRQGAVAEDLAPGPFDLITMWHALEHDYTPRETLRRLLAVARPGGTLVVEVPDYDSLTRRLQGAAWAGFHTPRHTAAYTPATLRALLERSGWTVVRQTTHGTFDPWVLWWLGRRTRQGDALDGDLERAFPGFMLGKLLTLPLALAQRWIRLGVQTAVARAPADRRPGAGSCP